MNNLFRVLSLLSSSLFPSSVYSESLQLSLYRVGSLFGEVNFASGQVMEATIKTFGGGITSYKFNADGPLFCNGNLRIRSSTDDSIIYGLTGIRANYPGCPSSATLVLRRIGAGPFITMELVTDVSDANSESQTLIGSFKYRDVENPSSN
jgi:hypothetical protein